MVSHVHQHLIFISTTSHVNDLTNSLISTFLFLYFYRSCLLLASEVANTLCTKRTSCILLGIALV